MKTLRIGQRVMIREDVPVDFAGRVGVIYAIKSSLCHVKVPASGNDPCKNNTMIGVFRVTDVQQLSLFFTLFTFPLYKVSCYYVKKLDFRRNQHQYH